MNPYSNSELLVDVDWLRQLLGDSHVRVLDVRASDPRLPVGYRMGHIPGAMSLDPTRDFFVFANGVPALASPAKIAEALGKRGISNETQVVIYDEWTGQLAAMTYWILRYVGHRNSHILHGGWAAWQNADHPVTKDVPQIAPAEFHADVDEAARATAEWIQANVERPDILLLDVRTPDEFRMGHIPDAVNLSYDAVLEPTTGTFADEGRIRALLESVGATPDKEIVTYCAAGARSAHMFATLQLLGYARVRNYDGSMADWYHARGLPVT